MLAGRLRYRISSHKPETKKLDVKYFKSGSWEGEIEEDLIHCGEYSGIVLPTAPVTAIILACSADRYCLKPNLGGYPAGVKLLGAQSDRPPV